MHYYHAKVRLKDSLANEVEKENLSAPEVIILRKIHGDNAVVNIRPSMVKEVDGGEERARLKSIYTQGLAAIDNNPLSVDALFGGEFVPLLDELPEFKEQKTAQVKTQKAAKALEAVI